MLYEVITGDSVFAHRPPEELKDAAWLYRQKRWKELKASLEKYIASSPASQENLTYARKLLDAYIRLESHAAATSYNFV